jgi:hypothetical protein
VTSARVARSVGTLGVLLLLCACAQRGVGAPPVPAGPALPTGPDELVLQVEHTGGFVPPETLVGRLPIVSVYADGRVLTEGPVIAIHPAPAWPNVQVQEIDRSAVRTLVEHARAAGVEETGDLGRPPLADVPSTRFTLATADGTTVREVYALTEVSGLDPADSGLTEQQLAARAELRAFLDELTDLPGTPAVPYEPATVAALVRPWATTVPDPADPAAEPAQPELRVRLRGSDRLGSRPPAQAVLLRGPAPSVRGLGAGGPPAGSRPELARGGGQEGP